MENSCTKTCKTRISERSGGTNVRGQGKKNQKHAALQNQSVHRFVWNVKEKQMISFFLCFLDVVGCREVYEIFASRPSRARARTPWHKK